RPGAIDPQRAQSLVQDKQQMAQELSELQKELRNSVHRHRDASEEAKRRLTEVVNDLESSDLMYRVRRSAAEIYYGRARDAAAREGIITEGLQNLDKDLGEAVALARRQDDGSKQAQGTTDRLLAEVADLRRRLEQQLRAQAASSAQSQSMQSQSQGENSAQPSDSERGASRGNAGADTRGDRELSAWDPILPGLPAEGRQVQGQDSLARQTEAIAD